MHLRDLLNPERAVMFAFRLFAVVFCLAELPSLVAVLLSRISGQQLLSLCLLWLALSPVAYLVRERRHPRPERRGAPPGAERTPLLPPNEEEP